MLNPSLAERGSPFQSGFSALGATHAEVPSVGATHPASEEDEDEALQTVLLMVCPPGCTWVLLLGCELLGQGQMPQSQAHQHLISFEM